jgi:hypothetical protein
MADIVIITTHQIVELEYLVNAIKKEQPQPCWIVNSFSNLIGSKKEYVLTGELFELANLLIGFYETIDIVI